MNAAAVPAMTWAMRIAALLSLEAQNDQGLHVLRLLRKVAAGRGAPAGGKAIHFSTKSAQRCTWSLAPHGMIGTVEVEFFGEPSMRRSE